MAICVTGSAFLLGAEGAFGVLLLFLWFFNELWYSLWGLRLLIHGKFKDLLSLVSGYQSNDRKM